MSVEDPSGRDLPPRDTSRHKLIEKLEARRDVHRGRAKAFRVLSALVGATVLLAGLAMLVLPGPAFAVIPLGLFVLALEFTWAERMLEVSLDQAEKAKIKAAETTRMQRLLGIAAMALAAAGAAAWAIWGDIPLLPV